MYNSSFWEDWSDFSAEGGGSMFLWNVGIQLYPASPNYKLQGHGKIIQLCNANCGAQASWTFNQL
jgi:hypothetical protein